jgi:dTDP-glucose 4,6-dehydratase
VATKRVLVTGGCGFIGSNFIRLLLAERPELEITNLDALTYAGNPKNLEDVADTPRYRFVHGDVRDAALVNELAADADAVVHFAAESHVDRSTTELAASFIRTNVEGTYNLLEAVRSADRGARFLQVGTDEVYGSVPYPQFPDETALPRPSSPYSASKAAADHIALSFHETHGIDVIVSRCTNNYGPYQYPEKVVPLFVTNALDDELLPLYDGGTQIRDWLRVEDHCRALLLLLEKGESGDIYNIGANQDPEVPNVEMTRMVLRVLDKSEDLIKPVSGLRPGHDQRYAVDTQKIRALGWAPRLDLEAGMRETVEWYRDRRDWWEPIKSGEYREFYNRHYGAALSDDE